MWYAIFKHDKPLTFLAFYFWTAAMWSKNTVIKHCQIHVHLFWIKWNAFRCQLLDISHFKLSQNIFQWAWVDRLQSVWFCGTFVGCKSLKCSSRFPDSFASIHSSREEGETKLGLPADPCALVWHLLAAAAALTLLKTMANVIELVCAKPQ